MEAFLKLLSDNEASLLKKAEYRAALKELNRIRFFVPETANEVPVVVAPVKSAPTHKVIAHRWSLYKDDHIWCSRKRSADSNDFYDTEDLMRKCLEHDWTQYALALARAQV